MVSREIKFRFFGKASGTMSPADFSLIDISCMAGMELLLVSEAIITMQFTGLTDKNGRDIYEGDILRHRFEGESWKNYKVVYKDAAFIADEIGSLHWFTLGKNSGFEIIGNVHLNPELLNA